MSQDPAQGAQMAESARLAAMRKQEESQHASGLQKQVTPGIGVLMQGAPGLGAFVAALKFSEEHGDMIYGFGFVQAASYLANLNPGGLMTFISPGKHALGLKLFGTVLQIDWHPELSNVLGDITDQIAEQMPEFGPEEQAQFQNSFSEGYEQYMDAMTNDNSYSEFDNHVSALSHEAYSNMQYQESPFDRVPSMPIAPDHTPSVSMPHHQGSELNFDGG